MGDGQLDHSIWKLDFGKSERGKTRYNMKKNANLLITIRVSQVICVPCLLSKVLVKVRNMELDFQD